ncbi:MAG: DOPA 4,5-dioxygenase family protein [Alphaproteobacteria bacterium]|nr:DOPA 4,5-dioxygenase family protein [Alphaproteobacteria bacterium]
MAKPSAHPSVIKGYHAHLYYTPDTRPVAARLRAAIEERFPQARIGNWHDEPVGPHPTAMYQVAFAVEEFPRLVPWLMLNREGLDILVHPLTDDSVADHTRFALWLGAPLQLRVEVLRKGPRTV